MAPSPNIRNLSGVQRVLCLAVILGCAGGTTPFVPQCVTPVPLTATEVETIIAQAVSRATADGNAFVVNVTNRDGVLVGSFQMTGAPIGAADSASTKAATAAFLSSDQHSFNTRTAEFIVDDHFPPGVPNVPGGPLYGVQFSSLPCSDVVAGGGVSLEYGSMPLYKGGCLVGAVAADGGVDSEDEERAAWAGSAGFRPDTRIFGDNIFIDGIRLTFIENTPPDIPRAPPPLDPDFGAFLFGPINAPPDMPFPTGVFGGLTCEIRFPIVSSPMAGGLTAVDVTAMFNAGAALSDRLRAGIRRPLGSAARLFIAVTDLDGNILGCIRTPEATLFSFDVSVQKARTAAFFSSDDAAFTTRGLGFLAQGFFPPGIDTAPVGPLNGLQDVMNPTCEPAALPLQNGITIFPGGVPLYKGGVLVGAIGVSGDGVDQDDMTASEGADLFPPPAGIKADELDEATAVAELRASVAEISAATADPALLAATALADTRLALGLQGIRLPYVKFPRQPFRD